MQRSPIIKLNPTVTAIAAVYAAYGACRERFIEACDHAEDDQSQYPVADALGREVCVIEDKIISTPSETVSDIAAKLRIYGCLCGFSDQDLNGDDADHMIVFEDTVFHAILKDVERLASQ